MKASGLSVIRCETCLGFDFFLVKLFHLKNDFLLIAIVIGELPSYIPSDIAMNSKIWKSNAVRNQQNSTAITGNTIQNTAVERWNNFRILMLQLTILVDGKKNSATRRDRHHLRIG